MDQIELLQQQFMELQQTKSNPLSDRTLVQLLLKLPSFGLIFYQTTDGNQYITQSHLQQTINQTVKERGKVLLGNLPQIIGLNLDVIQNRLNTVVNKYNIVRIDDKLMSQAYLNSLIQIINQKLQTRGRMNLEQISIEFGLPLTYTKKLINQRISELNAQLYNDQIITKQYNQLKLARLKGCLNGIARPTSLNQLIKKFNFDERNTAQAVQQLIIGKHLNGRVSYGIYIPKKFEENQMKMIQNFLSSNNYVEYNMLQKSFYINKPKQWLKSNFNNRVILLQQSAYSINAIQTSRNNIISLLKNEGFVETNKIFPPVFTQSDVELLITQHLKLQNILLKENYCFDPSWLDKCVNQFRQKIIFNIYFKTQEKNPKKKSKKQRINIEEMSILYQNALIDYNTLQDIKQMLFQILSPKIQQLYNKLNTQISQNKGIITSNLLKYRKCKTIFNNKQKCIRFLNTLEKQLKKSQKLWKDDQFGITQNDANGILSLIYFDKIVPKQWPSLQKLEWKKIQQVFVNANRSIKFSNNNKSKFLIKSKLLQVLQLQQSYNSAFPIHKYPLQFLSPQFQNFQKYGINVVKFNIQNQEKYIIVDNYIPILSGESFCSYSQQSLWISIIQKAYAKLRYCYKGILNVGFAQLVQQVLGLNCNRKLTDFKTKDSKRQLIKSLYIQVKQNMIIVGSEGELNSVIEYQGKKTGIKGNKNYLIYEIIKIMKQQQQNSNEIILFKLRIEEGEQILEIGSLDLKQDMLSYISKQIEKGFVFVNFEQLIRIFKNIYVISNH